MLKFDLPVASLTAGLLAALLLSGCVTTRTGPLPEPAAAASRVQAQLDLARGYIAEGQHSRARDPLDRALAIDPNTVEAYVLQAAVEENEGERLLAEKRYKTAIKINPGHAQALSNYGIFLMRQRRYEDALQPLRRAVEDTTYYLRAQTYENLGLAEKANGDLDAAKAAFQRALELNRSNQPTSALELAEMEYEAGNMTDALDLYEQYRRVSTPTARSLCLGIQINSNLNDTDAVSSYRLALKNLFPDSPRARRCQEPNS